MWLNDRKGLLHLSVLCQPNFFIACILWESLGLKGLKSPLSHEVLRVTLGQSLAFALTTSPSD